ncbi:hypothetical protein C8J57DRAFT_1275388 [Mycena rebaudengoi]|nr:hypothetical protein C8J57DRAFT_1275388 [Mycena rebaudengoi]
MSLPKLPPELECEIFEIAARSCREDLDPGLNLQLVARRVHIWTERVFLEVVALCDGRDAAKFLQLVDLKPADFFPNIVRALFLPYAMPSKTASKVLSVCTGVRILGCSVELHDASDIPFLIGRLPLTRLDTVFDHLSDIMATSAWLSTLTHLGLAFWAAFDDPIKLSTLCRQLPQLMHVDINDIMISLESRMSIARVVCSSCPKLQTVRLLIGGDELEVKRMDAEDPRIVWFRMPVGRREEPNQYSFAKDWVQPQIARSHQMPASSLDTRASQ